MTLDWSCLVIVLALSLGHASLMVGSVNRVYAWALPIGALHIIRHAHDLLTLAAPALFVWLYGVNGPRVLYGGPWHLIPWPILAYLAVCGVVALSLPVIAISRRRAKPIAALLSNHSHTIDVGERLAQPVGGGIIARCPGNEILRVEVSDKEFRLPRLPAEWDGLSILHLSDLHFNRTVDRSFFEHVVEIAQDIPADLVAFTGDLIDREETIDWLPATLGRLTAPLGCFFVLGNHDWYLTNTEDVRDAMESLGWRGVAGRTEVVAHRGRTLAVSGTEAPWMGSHPNPAAIPADAFRLLLSHTPDQIPWARRHRIDLMLAGHNHGGQVRLPLFGPVYSPSAYGTRYAGGSYWEPPTLLYVSRGLSGTCPLRWNCPPELTRLILRADDPAAHRAN